MRLLAAVLANLTAQAHESVAHMSDLMAHSASSWNHALFAWAAELWWTKRIFGYIEQLITGHCAYCGLQLLSMPEYVGELVSDRLMHLTLCRRLCLSQYRLK